MEILNLATVVYLAVIGVAFIIWGTNAESRFFGLCSISLAVANGLKLAALF